MNVTFGKGKQLSAGAVIVAAGSSERMRGEDKVFALLGGEPLLARVVDVFERCREIERIVVVVREEKVEEACQMAEEREWLKVAEVCPGGERRQDSVLAGLEALGRCQWVVVHDGARPLVTEDLVRQGLQAAAETGAAAAAVRVTDTIKVAGPDRVVRHTPARESLWAVQTPQVFSYDLLRKAYRRVRGDVTDDATAVEQIGERVVLYQGSYSNIKITTPNDLILAEVLRRKR